MGRNSGFIATHAALASCEVDLCLIPEDPFQLHGPGGVLAYIDSVLDAKGRCVVVVAEGAGAQHLRDTQDIGRYIKDEVRRHGAVSGRDVTTKFLDPCVFCEPASVSPM